MLGSGQAKYEIRAASSTRVGTQNSASQPSTGFSTGWPARRVARRNQPPPIAAYTSPSGRVQASSRYSAEERANRPDLERIVRRTPVDRQTLLFSATLAGAPGDLAREYTRNARRHTHKPTEQKSAQVEHRFVTVLHEAKLETLVQELQGKRDLALVFVRTKRGAGGVESMAIHGNKSQNQRERALAAFERWDVDVLIATDVAARGIDVADVSHVINFDAPEDQDGYVHRTGRTGRAGRDGVAITFVLGDQAREMGTIAKRLGLELPAHTSAEHGHAPARRQGRQRNNRRSR